MREILLCVGRVCGEGGGMIIGFGRSIFAFPFVAKYKQHSLLNCIYCNIMNNITLYRQFCTASTSYLP
jgi:hypothetical protein